MPPAPSEHARRPLVIAGIALVIAGVATGWLVRATGSQTETGADSAVVAVAAAPAAVGARAAVAAAPVALPPPATIPYPPAGEPGISTDDPLTAYRKANVYPPTSRPLSREQLDLLQPNTRHEEMRPAEHGEGVSYLFTADRYFVIGDEALNLWLEVRRHGAPLAVTITRAFAVVLDPATPTGQSDRMVALAFTASGKGYTHRFAPAQLGLARQTAIGMYIEFDDGFGLQRAHFDFQYTPAGGIPARFTGTFHDAVENGSLVIRAGIEVGVAGHYLIDANLYDANDAPIAWTRFKGKLEAGRQYAELVFFGKVLRDGQAAGQFQIGRFHIGQLRGARYAPELDPDLEQMRSFTGSFTTRPYATDMFSDAEWDGPDKQRMIDLLTHQGTHRGAAALGPNPPRAESLDDEP